MIQQLSPNDPPPPDQKSSMRRCDRKHTSGLSLHSRLRQYCTFDCTRTMREADLGLHQPLTVIEGKTVPPIDSKQSLVSSYPETTKALNKHYLHHHNGLIDTRRYAIHSKIISKHFLSAAYSRQVNFDYLQQKAATSQFKIKHVYLKQYGLANQHEAHDILTHQLHTQSLRCLHKPLFMLFRTEGSEPVQDWDRVHSFGIVVHPKSSALFFTGSAQHQDKVSLSCPSIQKNKLAFSILYPEEDLQADEISCDLLAYKMGKYVIDQINRDGPDSMLSRYTGTYQLPKAVFQYDQISYKERGLTQYSKLNQLLNSKTLSELTLSGNPRLAYRNIKRFLLFAHQSTLDAWINHSKISNEINPQIKETVKKLIQGNINQKTYRKQIVSILKSTPSRT